MIKFFNKIRYNLMETGKTGKYFKYAIGEIFLVVIGILIALQINNWNDAQKEKKVLHEYLTKVRNDIQLDITIIDSIRAKRVDVNKNCQLVVTKLMQNEFDLLVFIKGAEAFIDTYFVPNKNGYEALKNSTYLGKISGTKVDSLLDKYNNLTKQLVKEEEGFFAYIESMETIWTSEIDLMPILRLYSLKPEEALAYYSSEEGINSGIQQKIKTVFDKNSYKAVITRTAGQTLMLTYYSRLIDEGEKTIREINQYIND